MSEKHLTELGWKTLAATHKIKDTTLQKALARFGGCKESDHEGRLKALTELEASACDLKRKNGDNKEIAAYLAQMLTEIDKSHKTVELMRQYALKKADDDEAEKEAAEFKRNLKQQMVAALAQVKSRAPGDPAQDKEPKPQLQFMTYVAAKACTVVVARKVGVATKKLLQDIAGGAAGGRFFQGECIFEKSTHTFVLESTPGGLARKLAAALYAETGVKYKARLRTIDGSMTLDSDTDVDVDVDDGVKTAGPGSGSAGDMVAFTSRFKTLQPDLLKAIATRTPAGEEAKQRAEEAGALAGRNHLPEANRLLDAVEGLVKQALAAAAPTTTPAPGMKRAEVLEQDRQNWEKLATEFAELQKRIQQLAAASAPEAATLDAEAKAISKRVDDKEFLIAIGLFNGFKGKVSAAVALAAKRKQWTDLDADLKAAGVSLAQLEAWNTTTAGPLRARMTELERSAQNSKFDEACATFPKLKADIDGAHRSATEKRACDQEWQTVGRLYNTAKAVPEITSAFTALLNKLREAHRALAKEYTAGDYKKSLPLVAVVKQAAEEVLKAKKGNEARIETELKKRAVISPDQDARAAERLKALPKEDRKKFDKLVEDSRSEPETQNLRKALACGHPVEEVEKFAAKIRGKDEQWLLDNCRVTGSSQGKGVRQQFVMSCQATMVQAVKGELDPIYALKLHEENQELSTVHSDEAKPFAQEQKALLETPRGSKPGGVAVHRKDPSGAKGTGRRGVDLLNNAKDVTGIKYDTVLIEPSTRAAAVDDVATELGKARPVPLSVGGKEGQKAHYVLAVGVNPGPPKMFYIHDPGSGTTVARTEDQLKNNQMALPSGWSHLNKYEKPSPA